MRLTILAVVFTVIAGAALAQQQRMTREAMNDRMNEMKARYGQTFDQCQTLATSRGYRLSDNEFETRSVMAFIEGCIMGQQR